jgi:hypothetical protein
VVLGKAALAGEGRHHRHGEQLGELDELLGRLRVENALTGVHDWAFCCAEGLGDSVDIGAGGGGLWAGRGAVPADRVLVHLRLRDLEGDVEEDRTGAAGTHGGESAADELGDAVGVVDAGRKLGDGAEAREWIEAGG